MASKHDIFVVQDGPDVLVRPGTLISDRGNGGNGKTLKLRNLTGHTLWVEVPAGLSGALQSGPVKPKGAAASADKMDINVGGAADGDYPYKVWVLTSPPVEAQGESAPKIIIDP